MTGPELPEPRALTRAAVAVLAGGSGARLGAGVNKVYLPLAGHPVLGWSLRWAARVSEVTYVVLVARPEDVDAAEHLLERECPGVPSAVVIGGPTRHASEDAALAHLAPLVERGELDVIAIHDGARPLAAPALYRSVIRSAAEHGGALPAVPVVGVLPAGLAAPVPPGVVRVQTPQAFRARALLAAYAAAGAAGFDGSDTAASVEAFGDVAVRVVPGSVTNLKVTYADDLPVAERLLADAGYELL